MSVAALSARRAGARLLAAAVGLAAKRPLTTPPTRILFAPETVIDADPKAATDIYAGVFALAGETVDASGRSPFEVTPPSDAWERALHSFGWLVHLSANASELSSTNARALFDEWLSAASSTGRIAQEPTVMADRVTSWLVEAPLLLNGAPGEFRQRYLRALGRQLRRLERVAGSLPPGLVRLKAVAALATAGACVADEGRLLRATLAMVTAELQAQILPDGGHRSRNPEAIVTALTALLPLREALIRRQLALPGPLSEAIDRMLPMLRFLRHGDGMLAAFHGAPRTPDTVIDMLFGFDDVRGAASSNARYSGFQRLAAGDTVVIVDTAGVPDAGFSGSAHASALAFELSHGPDRIIVNCGPLGAFRSEWASAARQTAAHSTLVLADASSAVVMAGGAVGRVLGTPLTDGPTAVTVERSDRFVRAGHDGYQNRFGLRHTRTIGIGVDGLTVVGEDRLAGDGRLDRLAFALRFHLAPAVKLRLHRSRRQALLTLPNGAIWVFTVDEGPDLGAEASVAVLPPGEAHKSAQIVIHGNALTDHTTRWHLARQAGPLASPDAEPDTDPSEGADF